MELTGKTLKGSITLEGVGIHTGEISKITVHPSYRKGIYFIVKGENIPALHPFVVNTNLGTDLGKNGKVIRTVEHLMAAFYLLGIDSAIVEVHRGNEIPILDGSAKIFIEEFNRVGFEELSHFQEVIEIKDYYRIQPNGNFAELFPAEKGIFEFEGEFNRIGRVKVSFEEDKGIKETLVAARTFCYKDDIKKLQAANYGKGGYTINTLVVDLNDEEYDLLVYSSEPAYHKLLDLIGDLALLGRRIRGKIYSFKGGHRLNHMVREFLWKTSKDEKN